MSRNRDPVDWPPEAEKYPMLDYAGRRVTPEYPSFWRWIWSFIAG
ncbi:hypothetical protein Cwoe_5861 [Conexibacter woesei DSM 14684]|uniref:Uncharacterized protein n=1 Tax=Conexibacter woesei (strain DSM 14684 / CCUG 47730 / CIP 108061 / JCM 11494 / NBRC 100937 / ID131577) TaxID=469383 RepID=D3F2Y0_CONWI|nr:hypothetical protein Cwoe_5861 [Conexibacter woesei DSM 14684]